MFKVEHVDADGQLKSRHNFDNEGSPRAAEFYSEGKKVGETHFSDDGRPVQDTHFDEKGVPSNTYKYEDDHVGIQTQEEVAPATSEDLSERLDRVDEHREKLAEDLDSKDASKAIASVLNLYHSNGGPFVLNPQDHQEYIDDIINNKDNFNYVKDGDNYKVFGVHDPETGTTVGTPPGHTPPKETEHPEGNPVPKETFEALPDNLKPLVADLPPLDAPPKRLAQALEKFFDELSALDFSNEIAVGSALGALLSSEDPASAIRLGFNGLLQAVDGMRAGHLQTKKNLERIKAKRGFEGRPRAAGQVNPKSWLGKRTLKKTQDAMDAVKDLNHPNLNDVLGSREHWTPSRHRQFQRQMKQLTDAYAKDSDAPEEKLGRYQAVLNKILIQQRNMGAAEAGYYIPHTTPSEQDLMNTQNVYSLLAHMGGLSEKEVTNLTQEINNWSAQTLREVRRAAFAGMKQRADKMSFGEVAPILDTAHRIGKDLHDAEDKARKKFNSLIPDKTSRIKARGAYGGRD